MAEPARIDPEAVLVGEHITLRPLRPADFEPLYAAAADPLIWEQHADPTRYQRDVFEREFFAGAVASGSAYVVIENGTGRVIGSTRFYDWQPDPPEVAIGYTFLARSHWGGAANGEMKRLMLAHAFRSVAVVWFHIAKSNWRSRKAVEKIGGRLSHEGHKTMAGKVHEYVFYRIDAPK